MFPYWYIISGFLVWLLFFSCGNIEQDSGNIGSANRSLRYVSDFQPDTATVAGERFLKGLQFTEETRYDSALTRFREVSSMLEREERWEEYVHCANKIGEILTATGKYPDAENQLATTFTIAEQKLGNTHVLVGETSHFRGINFRFMSQYARAVDLLKQAIAIRIDNLGDKHPEVAISYDELGIVYRFQGDYDRSITFHELAASILQNTPVDRDAELGSTYNNLAGAFWTKGDYEKSLDYLYKALPIWQSTLGPQHPRTAFAYSNIGILYAMKGDYERAIEFTNKALAVYLPTIGAENQQAGTAYNNLGEIYQLMGDYEKAIEFHSRGLEIRKKIFDEPHPEIVYSYHNIATDYLKSGESVKALEFANKAISGNLQVFGERHQRLAESYQTSGLVYLETGEYQKALQAFNKALAIVEAIFKDYHPDIAKVYNYIGKTYQEKREARRAFRAFQLAIEANIPSLLNTGSHAIPPLNDVLSEEQLLISLQQKADLLSQNPDLQGTEQQNLQTSLAFYQQAARLMDQMRIGYKASGSKLLLADKTNTMFEKAIQTAVLLHGMTADIEYLEAAFAFSEKSKTGILLESFSEAKARRFAGIPDSLLEKERRLRIDLTAYQQSLFREQLKKEQADSAKLHLWENKIFQLKLDYDNLLRNLERDYHDYHNLKYQLNAVTIPEIRREALDQSTALVEYFVGENALFIFVVTGEEIALKQVAKTADFNTNIKNLRKGILNHDFHAYANAAHQLFNMLVQPISEEIAGKDLLIIPEGPINYIPFEVLLTEPAVVKADIIDYRDLSYLLRKHRMSYAYSATLYTETQRRPRQSPEKDFLAFAPVFSAGFKGDTTGLELAAIYRASNISLQNATGYLPSSKKEVEGINQLFNDEYGFFGRLFAQQSQVFLEKHASEKNFKNPSSANFRFVHLATHGFVNEEKPGLSGLLLSPDESSEDDGVLYLSEVYNLQLNAELMTLSACETGLGKIARGEGLIGFTRGFLYAGAQNLLVSLWKVNDASTSRLMIDFYKDMLGGNHKPAALQTAKLNLIKSDAKYADPYYWAPFVLIGR